MDSGWRFDYLILAPGAAHSYFGHEEWAEHAPGLKTLDDALKLRRRMLLAFEEAERETDPPRKRHLLTFVSDRRRADGRRTGRRAGRDRAPYAAPRVRCDRSRIGAHRPDRGGGDDSADVPAIAARFGAARAAQARRRGLGARAVTGVEAETVIVGADRLACAHDHLGCGRRRHRRLANRSMCRFDRAGRVDRACPICRCRATRRSSSPATWRISRIRPASRCPASRKSRSSRASTPLETCSD